MGKKSWRGEESQKIEVKNCKFWHCARRMLTEQTILEKCKLIGGPMNPNNVKNFGKLDEKELLEDAYLRTKIDLDRYLSSESCES